MHTLVVGIIAGFAVTQIAIGVTTVYLHRSLTHRAVTFAPVLSACFAVLVWISIGIRPRQWVAVHRKHHAHTDTPDDPHSPVVLGWRRVQLTNVVLYRRCAADPRVVARYAKDLPARRVDRLLFDHALVGLSIGISILVAIVGVRAAMIAATVHVVSYLLLSGAVNGPGHHFGRRPDPTSSATNLRWLTLLTAGEGLHNNHHAAPTSARFARRWGDLDTGWWAIRFAAAVGLADVHRAVGFDRSPRRRARR